jgi:hypothetical protein
MNFSVSRREAYVIASECLVLYKEYEKGIPGCLRNPLSNRTTSVPGICWGIKIDDDYSEAALRLAVMGAISMEEVNAVRNRHLF